MFSISTIGRTGRDEHNMKLERFRLEMRRNCSWEGR